MKRKKEKEKFMTRNEALHIDKNVLIDNQYQFSFMLEFIYS